MQIQTTIERKLQQGMPVNHLSVENESHMHNVPADSETHFRVVIVSEGFSDKNLVARHRTVNKLLADELKGGVHALALHTFTPEEWQKRGASANASPACRGGSSA